MKTYAPWAVLKLLNRFFIFLFIVCLTGNALAGEMTGADLYKLGSGDKIRVNVYGEPDLSRDIEVDGSGSVSLPLIGEVRASGLSLREFEDVVEKTLKAGYLVDPKVSVEVLNYRPFYILGEVKNPGKYDYISGITVLNAVAMAGGYTYRARGGVAEILRVGNTESITTDTPDTTLVMPGDVIKIPERYF
jgi:protein involved in polysaccharide export with SLBB domain